MTRTKQYSRSRIPKTELLNELSITRDAVMKIDFDRLTPNEHRRFVLMVNRICGTTDTASTLADQQQRRLCGDHCLLDK